MRDYLVAVFPENTILNLMGLVLMFGGGTIAVSSLLRLMKSVQRDISSTVQAQRSETLREITNLRASLSETQALITREVMELRTKRTCKFCGATMT